MTTEKRQQARAEIIGAAIDCISEKGVGGATVRAIADRAGVNPAAISYYFGGREQLIDAALSATISNAFDLSDIEVDAADDYKTVLTKMLSHWYDGAARYPGITRAHFDEVLHQRAGAASFLQSFDAFLKAVYSMLIKHGLPETDDSFARLKMVYGAYTASLLFPTVARPAQKKEDVIRLLVGLL